MVIGACSAQSVPAPRGRDVAIHRGMPAGVRQIKREIGEGLVIVCASVRKPGHRDI